MKLLFFFTSVLLLMNNSFSQTVTDLKKYNLKGNVKSLFELVDSKTGKNDMTYYYDNNYYTFNINGMLLENGLWENAIFEREEKGVFNQKKYLNQIYRDTLNGSKKYDRFGRLVERVMNFDEYFPELIESKNTFHYSDNLLTKYKYYKTYLHIETLTEEEANFALKADGGEVIYCCFNDFNHYLNIEYNKDEIIESQHIHNEEKGSDTLFKRIYKNNKVLNYSYKKAFEITDNKILFEYVGPYTEVYLDSDFTELYYNLYKTVDLNYEDKAKPIKKFDDKSNLVEIQFFRELNGVLNVRDEPVDVFKFQFRNNNIIKYEEYYGSIDTTDLGYEIFDKTGKVPKKERGCHLKLDTKRIYNKHQNVIEVHNGDLWVPNEGLEKTYKYIYDNYNNWVRREEYDSDGNLTITTLRKLEYYD